MSRVVALSLLSVSLASVAIVAVHGAKQQAALAPGANNYVLGPDSQLQPGVPQGTVTQYLAGPARSIPGPCGTTGSTCPPSTTRRRRPA